ncbi:HPr kinase/phosphatase C-terminal domain-containing protein [Sphingobium sp. H39-3-25]|uniref:HPr kinase/phosphorylase n=1 Tax=Sphingobium arseniciresistens TaxID=3030834 RepID=UPI0023B90299|nr:HPr kinase/phosphatase C-terminal domain-containing protein [Sphingobium arseniciresistens]
MAAISSETLHASTVSIDGRAVMLSGSSGAGKSDLALRLIDRGARLVSDDYTVVRRVDGQLSAAPPATIAGKMEVRGIGVVEMDHVTDIPVALLVDLVERVDRMPMDNATRDIAGVKVPVVRLPALEPSSPIKVEIALKDVIARKP